MTGEQMHGIRWANVLWLRSLALVSMPFLVAIALTIVFANTLDAEKMRASAVGSDLFNDATIDPLGFSSLFFFLATIAHVAWSQMLRACGIKHWMIYGLAVWVLLRAFWWLMHALLQSPIWVAYIDRLPSVGGSFGMIFAAILAIVGIYISIRAAVADRHLKMMWVGIGFTAPFIAMIITVTVTTSAGAAIVSYLFSDLCAFLILGFGAWVFKLVSKRTSSPTDSKPELESPGWSSRIAPLLIVVTVASILGISSIILRQQLVLHPTISLSVDWFIVIGGTSGAYLLLAKISRTNMLLQWTGLTLLITTYPEGIYLEDWKASENIYLHDYSNHAGTVTFLPFGLWVMAPLLIINMLFDASMEIKTVFVGGMSAAPVMFALAQPELILPSGQFDAMFVLAPTLVLIALGVVVFGLFKLHRVEAGQFGKRPPNEMMPGPRESIESTKDEVWLGGIRIG